MNIVMFGAGALGAYYGGRWAEAGQNVSFLVREKRKKQIEEQGLNIHSVAGDYQLENPKLIVDPDEAEACDLLVLSVKGYHLSETLPALKKFVARGARVLPLLNGIEHIYKLQEELGEEAVLGGSAFIIATLDEKGHPVHTSESHDIVYGPLHPSQEKLCTELEQVMQNSNMNGILSGTISKSLWQKYMFITAFSGVTTAANLPIGRIREQEDTLLLFRSVLQEMKNLANAFDIDLGDKEIEETMGRVSGLSCEATSSMHQDRRKGLSLEVDHLQGGALRLAKQCGLRLPHIETLHALIKPFESGNLTTEAK
ncbi:ketopantoate reductase family protein [Fictibacillus fluitans]|uniref:2-dehydropantoate 2-reductase n=1 Tax=Fictibacillus fluitans TaxID=3058422 RepID=A0ABT8HVD7_9BACL|nr:ketopantoate reductase family protein [Fictibacillus sp. NE201]MDN4524742.1 ketopantoate reductase family protein [Fictibacillus sp. NE201]